MRGAPGFAVRDLMRWCHGPTFAAEASVGDAPAIDRTSIDPVFPPTEVSAVNRLAPLVLCVAMLGAANASAQGAVERPQFAVGDRWTLRVTDLQKNEETQTYENRVTTIAGDTVRMSWKILSSTNASDVDRQGTSRFDASTWAFDVAQREGKLLALAFPLEVGKSWEYAYASRNTTGGETTVTMKAKVEAWEEIRIPAGTFKALRVVHEGQWATRNHFGEGVSSVILDTYWYVPELKRTARHDYFVRGGGRAVYSNTRTDIISAEVAK
jgi:hypothetical protein